MADLGFDAKLCLYLLSKQVKDLLFWATHPHPQPLNGEWLAAVKDGILRVTDATLEAVQRRDGSVAKKIKTAQNLAFEFATLLCDRPALSTVAAEEWTVPQYRHLFNDLSELEREFRRLGDVNLPCDEPPRTQTIPAISQRFESRLAWPEWPRSGESFIVLRKVCQSPSATDDFAWIGSFWNGTTDILERLHGEPVAGSVVSYGSLAKPVAFYVLTEVEVSALREAFPDRDIEDVRLSEVFALLRGRGHDPNGLDAKSLLRLLMKPVEVTTPPVAPSSESKPDDDVAETIKRVALMLGEDGGKIMAIVSHPTYTTDQKLRALGVDERFKGYKSDDLAKMLGVSPASIRNSDVWKEWHPKLSTKRAKSAQK